MNEEGAAGGDGGFTQGRPGYLGVGVGHQLQQPEREIKKNGKKERIGNELLSICDSFAKPKYYNNKLVKNNTRESPKCG